MDSLSEAKKFVEVGFMTPTIEQIVEELEKNKNRRSVSMTEIGIGIRQSNDGSLG